MPASSDDPLNQDLGAVVTKQGRCIAFPNVFQHKVQPFELVDKSKPGHRKIIALFLVDPALPTPRPSTSNIPFQQKDWARTMLQEIASDLRQAHGVLAKGLAKLPVEVVDMIIDQADFLMSRKEAEEFRLVLMAERSITAENSDATMFTVQFNMCEH